MPEARKGPLVDGVSGFGGYSQKKKIGESSYDQLRGAKGQFRLT